MKKVSSKLAAVGGYAGRGDCHDADCGPFAGAGTEKAATVYEQLGAVSGASLNASAPIRREVEYENWVEAQSTAC